MWVSKDAAHALSCRGELTHVQQFVFEKASRWCIFDHYVVFRIFFFKDIAKLLRSIYKSQLIWGSRVVSTFTLINYDSVTGGQENKNTYQRLMVVWIWVFKNSIELGVYKANIIFLLWVQVYDTILILFFPWNLICSIRLCSCWKLSETHNIACKCSCFIREHVFNLSKFLIEITGLCPHLHILLLIVHVNISWHEYGLEEFNHLCSNHKWYWNKIRKDKDPGTEFLPKWEAWLLLRDFSMVHFKIIGYLPLTPCWWRISFTRIIGLKGRLWVVIGPRWSNNRSNYAKNHLSEQNY